MKNFVICLCLCLFACAAANASIEDKDDPISKVVTLLKDLKSKIEKDADVDQADYDKYRCWCEEVAVSKQKLMLQKAQQVEDLKVQIAMGNATSVIHAQNLQGVAAGLNQAGGAIKTGLTTDNKTATVAKEVVKDNIVVNQTFSMFADTLAAKAGVASGSAALIQTGKVKVHRQGASLAQMYEPASAEIQGMLRGTASNAAVVAVDTNKTETARKADFNSWLADKKDEVGLMKATQLDIATQKSALDTEMAEDTEMKDDTVEQMKADEAFLIQSQASCAAADQAFLNRTDLRTKELEGVNQALKILDDNRALLTKSKSKSASSFLQISSVSSAAQRAQNAYAVLKKQATHTHSLRLAALAAQIHEAVPAGFSGVIKAIDDMVANLKLEAQSDLKKKDFCTSENQRIAKEVKKISFLIQKNTAHIGEIDAKVAKLNDDVAHLQDEMNKVNKSMAPLEAERIAQNAAFKAEKADNEMAITVLGQVLDKLKAYYANKDQKPASFIAEGQDPDHLSKERRDLKNKEYKYDLTDKDSQKGAAMAIVATIEHLQDNLRKDIAEDMKDEAAAQIAYEKNTAMLNASMAKLVQEMTSIQGMLSVHGGNRADEATQQSSNQADLDGISQQGAALKPECDWLLSKFKLRAQNREAEMDGLVQAKELLSGASLVEQSSQVERAEDEEDHSSLIKYFGLQG